jgi:hypothetical protein
MTLTRSAEQAVPDTATDVRVDELTDQERLIFEAGFMHGYSLAAAGRQAEIDALNWEADRLYAEVCRRPAPRQPEGVTYAELCRRRGENDRAERNERCLREWFLELFTLTP